MAQQPTGYGHPAPTNYPAALMGFDEPAPALVTAVPARNHLPWAASCPRPRSRGRHSGDWACGGLPFGEDPAFGVPTLVTSSAAYTPGYRVCRVRGGDLDPAVGRHPRLGHDGGRAVHGDAEEQVVGQFSMRNALSCPVPSQ
jgi:hypothetical protein